MRKSDKYVTKKSSSYIHYQLVRRWAFTESRYIYYITKTIMPITVNFPAYM